MNRALWKKAISDAWVQLTWSCLVLVLFGWLFVWLTSLLKIGAWGSLLGLIPDLFRPLMGVPLAKLTEPAGPISFLYVHVIVLLVCVGWAIGRGSDVVAGEISRGGMEHLLTLPVWRVSVLLIPSLVTTLGTVLLSLSLLLGTWIGLVAVGLLENVSIGQFIPGAVNLFFMVFCLTGITTLISSAGYDRWKTIWRAGIFFVVSLIIKAVFRMWPDGAWLKYGTFLAAYEPQSLILSPESAWSAGLHYNAVLLALGLISYLAAGIIFAYRDIPLSR